jgi:hypothetical protein
MLIAGLLILLPTGPRAETSPPPLIPPSITGAIDAVASRSDQCPNEEALQSLVEEAQSPSPHRAIVVATYTAERLRAGGWGAARGQQGDSQCDCIERLSNALTPADAKSAGEVHKVFAEAFPDCDKKNTLLTRDALSPGSAAPDSRLPEWKSLPEFGLFGDPTPICKRDCGVVEPPPANDASRTAL